MRTAVLVLGGVFIRALEGAIEAVAVVGLLVIFCFCKVGGCMTEVGIRCAPVDWSGRCIVVVGHAGECPNVMVLLAVGVDIRKRFLVDRPAAVDGAQ